MGAIQSLFEELVDLSPAEQSRRLNNATQSPAIVAQTRALLAAVGEEGILDMAAPSIDGPASATSYRSLAEGQIVGGFTVQRLIGRGGMGEVYLAQRTAKDPIVGWVAPKGRRIGLTNARHTTPRSFKLGPA